MKKIALVLLLGCSSSTETNIPQNDTQTPTAKVQDASSEDGQTSDNSVDGNHDGNTKGTKDTGLLDISVNPFDTTEEPTTEVDDANPETGEPDVEGSPIDAGTNETSEDTSQNPYDSETAKDANFEIDSLIADGAIASEASVDGAIASETSVSVGCSRGCALQGHFACWPIREHPTFDVIIKDFVVQDRCTGLQWESNITSASAYYTFDEAVQACKSKNLPVPKDTPAKWRMPTRIELASIIDYTTGGPAVDISTFGTFTDQLWTLNQTADGLSGWTISMYEGAIRTKKKTTAYYGRCVLDPIGDLYQANTLAHYDQSIAGEVKDNATLLTWESWDNQNAAMRSLADATSYCASKGPDWRLPSLKELLSISSDENAVDPQLFPNLLRANYWTSSTVYSGGMTERHWALHFDTGITNENETLAYVRCVR